MKTLELGASTKTKKYGSFSDEKFEITVPENHDEFVSYYSKDGKDGKEILYETAMKQLSTLALQQARKLLDQGNPPIVMREKMMPWELGLSVARKRSTAPENATADFLADFAAADKNAKRALLEKIFGIAGGSENMTLNDMLAMLSSSDDDSENESENNEEEDANDSTEDQPADIFVGGAPGENSGVNEETESLLPDARRPRTGRR